MAKFSFRSKNETIAKVIDTKLKALASGNTELKVYDEAGVYRGQVPVSVSASDSPSVVEPTEIRLNYSTYQMTTSKSSTALKATVYPSNASNNTVIWESSNSKVVAISSAGKLCAQYQEGEAVITAYTYDKKLFATCVVTVNAEGTLIKSISPSSIEIKEEGDTKTIKINSEFKSNYDSGFTDFSNYYNWYTTNRDTSKVETPSSLNIIVTRNWGNAREFKIWFHGNFIDETGAYLTVKQAGSTVARLNSDYSKAYFNADGSYYIPSGMSVADISTGGIKFTCAAGNAWNIIRGMTADSWIKINKSYLYMFESGSYSSSKMLQYENTGKIDGKDPGFNGKIVTCQTSFSVTVNTGGQRTGYITLPGGNKLTVSQRGV